MDRMTEAAEFKREMNRNYMILRPETDGNERYAVRMFTDNQIPGFLPFHEKAMNGERKHYYDITSKQPLGRILESRCLSGEELEKLFSALLFSLKQVERFLLNESCILLEPEYIYVEPDSFRCFFCYVPGKYMDFSKSLTELSQYLLDHVNHRDGEAVVLAFAVFKECRKENFGMEDIERCLEKRSGGGAASATAGNDNISDGSGLDVSRGSGSCTPMESAPARTPLQSFNAPSPEVGPEAEPGAGRQELDSFENFESRGNRNFPLLGMFFAVAMVLLPAAVIVLWGIPGLMQYKWILGASEILLGTVLILVLSGSNKVSRKEKILAKEPENTKNTEEKWEVYFREEDDIPNPSAIKEPEEILSEPEEMQTVLLTSRPVTTNCRKLVSMTGGLEIPVGYFPFLIGKSRDMVDFCLNEPGVSRLHMKIEANGDGYSITDLNSTNGTRVDGRLLEANETCSLLLGSEVEIASRRFVFR